MQVPAIVSVSRSWIRDPKLARTLARVTWFVLVWAFVLLTRFGMGPTARSAALALLLSVVVVLNAPVVVGLYESRAQAGSPAFRAVALMLGLRVVATVAVMWVVSAR